MTTTDHPSRSPGRDVPCPVGAPSTGDEGTTDDQDHRSSFLRHQERGQTMTKAPTIYYYRQNGRHPYRETQVDVISLPDIMSAAYHSHIWHKDAHMLIEIEDQAGETQWFTIEADGSVSHYLGKINPNFTERGLGDTLPPMALS